MKPEIEDIWDETEHAECESICEEARVPQMAAMMPFRQLATKHQERLREVWNKRRENE